MEVDLMPSEGAGMNTHLFIATNSLCSLHQIRTQPQRPKLLELSKHKGLLSTMPALLATRAAAGKTTALIKTKADAGVRCNDMADELAKRAARHHTPTTRAEVGIHPYEQL